MPARDRRDVSPWLAPVQAPDDLGAGVRRLADLDVGRHLVDRNDVVGGSQQRQQRDQRPRK
ncbi:MAG: hypothetical protein GWP60_02905 [Gammaproteobacteria bacterium]|nr:hypothetical protein [Gammaproteobacteria bacterium]